MAGEGAEAATRKDNRDKYCAMVRDLSVAYNDKKTGQRHIYKYPHSSYGSKVNRCCNTCDLRVQYWRGEAMTDRSVAAKRACRRMMH
jgi:hypothetical protein